MELKEPPMHLELTEPEVKKICLALFVRARYWDLEAAQAKHELGFKNATFEAEEMREIFHKIQSQTKE
jgi:hypothetical protein